MTNNRSPRWPLAVALVLICAAAASLRLIGLPSLPLGLHYDEAANGILAAEIARGAEQPIFIASYTGKEVLFFYWAAAWMRALGESTLALRLTSAVAGLCTVGAAAWSTYELFRERRDAAWIGALTAAFLATSFWHVILGRTGFRAITQPLLQALTVGALWRGLRLEHKGWLLLAGLFCGATAYTYLAARAFPLPLGIALVSLLAADRGRRRTRLGQLALFVTAAAVAIAPLVAYFVTHPAALTTRMGQVAAASWEEVWAGIRACLGMFFLQGDPYIRFNLPGRPLFGPITAVLFLLGFPTLLLNTQSSPKTGLSRATRALLLTVLPVMLLPSALATGEITPSNLRVVGMLPFIYIFPTLSIAEGARIANREVRNMQFANSSFFRFSFLVVILAATSIPTTMAFREWATSPALYDAADGDLVDVAAYLNGTDIEDVVPYVASIHYRHPTLAFLAEDYPAVKWITGGESLVVPPTEEGLLVLPRSSAGSRGWIEALGLTAEIAPTGPGDTPAFTVYRVPSQLDLVPTHAITANFGNVVSLLGYEELEPAHSGGAAEVLLFWRVENPINTADMLPIARIADPWGNVWGEARPFHYPGEQWAPGEVVIDHLSVPVAPGTPPGEYTLSFGFFAASTGGTLPVLDASGAYAGTAVELPITIEPAVAPADPAALEPRQQLDRTTDAGVALLGANLDTTALRPGEPVYLTLFWEAIIDVEADLSVRLELGESLLYEGSPVHATYPTTDWSAGTVLVDRYDPRLDRFAEPGTFPLRLTLVDAGGRALIGPLSLGSITVEQITRTFEPPLLDHTVGTSLGDQVALLGYDLTPENPTPGTPLTLTLYWHALQEMSTSYTVFIHLLGPGGSLAQHDSVPANGTYPTSLWVTGEVVADTHTLSLPTSLPTGVYELEVGMYVAETGTRLAIPGTGDDALHIPLTFGE
jgi:hypothetical protein